MKILRFYNNDWEPLGIHHEAPVIPSRYDIVVIEGTHYQVKQVRYVFDKNHIPARESAIGVWPASVEHHTRIEIRIEVI